MANEVFYHAENGRFAIALNFLCADISSYAGTICGRLRDGTRAAQVMFTDRNDTEIIFRSMIEGLPEGHPLLSIPIYGYTVPQPRFEPH